MSNVNEPAAAVLSPGEGAGAYATMLLREANKAMSNLAEFPEDLKNEIRLLCGRIQTIHLFQLSEMLQTLHLRVTCVGMQVQVDVVKKEDDVKNNGGSGSMSPSAPPAAATSSCVEQQESMENCE